MQPFISSVGLVGVPMDDRRVKSIDSGQGRAKIGGTKELLGRREFLDSNGFNDPSEVGEASRNVQDHVKKVGSVELT